MGRGGDDGSWGGPGGGGDGRPPPLEVEPDYGLSGALAKEANTTTSGVTLVYSEPAEGRAPPPKTVWRLYCFKGEAEAAPPLPLSRQSAFRVGRERSVADVVAEHPSVSKQHAALQWRLTEKVGPDGLPRAAVRLYVMDLGSTNGTLLNGERVEGARYYELLHQDTLRFGLSSREYVIIDTAAK